MTTFRATAGMRPRAPDGARTLAAIRGTTDFAGRPLAAPAALARLSTPDVVVFAGTEDRSLAPRMAIQYTAEAASGGKWRLIADAATGEVLHVESLIVFDDVTGNVAGNATPGGRGHGMRRRSVDPFPFAEVDGPSPELAFTDVNGAYTLVNSVPGPLNVTSLMGGQFFDVVNLAGGLETLTSSVTPPAMDSFVHNTREHRSPGARPGQRLRERQPDARVPAQVPSHLPGHFVPDELPGQGQPQQRQQSDLPGQRILRRHSDQLLPRHEHLHQHLVRQRVSP